MPEAASPRPRPLHALDHRYAAGHNATALPRARHRAPASWRPPDRPLPTSVFDTTLAVVRFITTRAVDGVRLFGQHAYYTVRIRGPSSVTATVCSQCAARDPSAVTTVHSSSSTAVFVVPRVSIGSIASTEPGARWAPGRGAPSLGRNGSRCIGRPMPCPPYPATMPNLRW